MRSQKLFSQNVLLFSVSHEKTLHIFCMPYDLNVLSKFELRFQIYMHHIIDKRIENPYCQFFEVLKLPVQVHIKICSNRPNFCGTIQN